MGRPDRAGREVASVRGVASIALVLGTVLLGGGLARADVLQDLGATFQLVARELAGTFPRVEARVVAVEGEEVRLQGDRVQALRPGLELTAYRKGRVFRHPVTNQPLAQGEEEVATLVVTAVAPASATARVVPGPAGLVPAVGDGARITAGRLPVAVLPPVGVVAPFEAADQTAHLLVARFSALLEKTGRFLAVDPRRVLEAAGVGTEPVPAPAEVARRLGAPAVLATRLVQDGGARQLEVTWVSARTGATLAAIRTPLLRASFPPRFAWEQTPELERRYVLEGTVRGLAVADVDGDGRPELVVGDEETVAVYRWQEGRGLVAVPGAEVRPGGLVLSVDAADVNGTGRAQVVVVTDRGEIGGIHAAVVELAGERFRTLHETRGRYLRVVRVGAESWLLEQDSGSAEPFAPAIRRLLWQDGRYRDGPALRVPDGVTVYGLALTRLTGSADPDIVALTSDDRLAVWTWRGQRLWTSADSYGGSAVAFPYTPALPTRASRVGEDVIGRILGRVVALAEGPDGPEVLVFENLLPVGGQARTMLPRLAPTLFTQGRIHRLRWKDGGFVRAWQSGITPGYIADFGYGDLDGDGVAEVVVGVVPRGFSLDTLNPLARPRAQVVFYELP